MNRIRSGLRIGIWLTLAGISALAFYDRYWRWRDCFNELGRCYDAESRYVFVEGAGFVWSSLTVLFLVLAAFAWRRARRS